MEIYIVLFKYLGENDWVVYGAYYDKETAYDRADKLEDANNKVITKISHTRVL